MTRAIGTMLGLAVGLTVLEIALPIEPHVPPGVTALFSFVGCAAIVLVSKALGKRWLQRPEPPDE